MYTEELMKWQKYAETEFSRRQARQRLHDFIEKETGPGGALDNPKVSNLLRELSSKQDLTTEEYCSELRKWKTHVEIAKEDQRIKAHQKPKVFISSIDGGVLEDQKSRNEIFAWHDGSTEKYNAELEKWEKLCVEQKERLEAKKALNDFIKINTEPGALLEDIKTSSGLWRIATWQHGSTDQYKRELQRWSRYVDDEKESRQLIRSYAGKSSPDQHFKNSPELSESLSNVNVAVIQTPLVDTSRSGSIEQLDAAEKKIQQKVELNKMQALLDKIMQDNGDDREKETEKDEQKKVSDTHFPK